MDIHQTTQNPMKPWVCIQGVFGHGFVNASIQLVSIEAKQCTAVLRLFAIMPCIYECMCLFVFTAVAVARGIGGWVRLSSGGLSGWGLSCPSCPSPRRLRRLCRVRPPSGVGVGVRRRAAH